MNLYKAKMKIIKLKDTGFFSIFLSSVFSKIIVFFGGIVVVRILSKSDYGIYTYIMNAISMMFLLGDFGAGNVTMQLLGENYDNREKKVVYLKYGLKIGILATMLACLLILFSSYFYPFEIGEAKNLTYILFLVPLLTTLTTFINVVLRIELMTKKYGVLQIITTFLCYLFLIPLTLKFGIMGAMLSQYCYLILTLIIGIIFCRKTINIFEKNTLTLTKKEKKDFLKLAFTTQISNTIDRLLVLIDVFLIGVLITDPTQVAAYKVASTIPQAIVFIPSAIMIYILPYYTRNNNNIKWLNKTTKQLLFTGVIFYGIITVGLLVFSEFIITLIFGAQYQESIICFRLLIIGFFFLATFKLPINNILYTMRKVKFNLIITLLSGILNLITNIYFIKQFGIIGAGITTCTIMIFNAIISVIFLRYCLKRQKIGLIEKLRGNSDDNK